MKLTGLSLFLLSATAGAFAPASIQVSWRDRRVVCLIRGHNMIFNTSCNRHSQCMRIAPIIVSHHYLKIYVSIDSRQGCS